MSTSGRAPPAFLCSANRGRAARLGPRTTDQGGLGPRNGALPGYALPLGAEGDLGL